MISNEGSSGDKTLEYLTKCSKISNSLLNVSFLDNRSTTIVENSLQSFNLRNLTAFDVIKYFGVLNLSRLGINSFKTVPDLTGKY